MSSLTTNLQSNQIQQCFNVNQKRLNIEEKLLLDKKIEKKSFILTYFNDNDDDNDQNQNQNNTNNLEVIKVLNIKAFQRESNSYLNIPIPKNAVFQCIIRRDKSKITGKYQYHLYDSSLLKHIITIKNGPYGYEIYQKNIQNKQENNIVGSIESNFFGTQFQGFQGKRQNKSQIITINYETNLFGLKGPRKMEIYIPKESTIITQDSLQSIYQVNGEKIQKFINKAPKWNKEVGAYVLNFKGRATHSSVKNFLIIRENEEKTYALFGKIGKQIFNMDIRHPFSIMQGACMAISSFDRKLACE